MSILCSGWQNIRRLRVKSAKATQMAQAQRRVNEQRAHACIHIYLRSRLATLRMREVSLKRLSCTSQLFCELCALPSSRRRRGPSRFRASERKQTGASTRPNMTVSRLSARAKLWSRYSPVRSAFTIRLMPVSPSRAAMLAAVVSVARFCPSFS